MEAKRLSKAQQRSSMDIITALPQAIIETILCLLPIEEAARTSILSKEWRFKWTKIPKLVFHKSTVKMSTEERHLSDRKQISELERARRNKEMRCKLFYAIHQVLLQRQSPIHEFTLCMDDADETCFEIDQIILHLSRNHTLKKLTLDLDEFGASRLYVLPLSVFSLHHLTDLYLKYCDVNHKTISSGLGSLTSLTLNNTWISTESLLHLLSNCPSLKSLCLMLEDSIPGYSKPGVIELFKCLPVLEHLTTRSYVIIPYALDWVQEELPTSLIHLKYVCIEELGFGDGFGLTFLGFFMKCAPNLEKIKLEIETDDDYDNISPVRLQEYSVILEEYSDVWLEHLNELEITGYRNVELELVFVKFILAKSPNLKKVILRMFSWEEECEMLKILLSAPRASLVVEIVVDF